MTTAERFLIMALGRSLVIRRLLKRWALRYAARLLRKLGPAHSISADFLQSFGERQEGNGRQTWVGLPAARRPATRSLGPSSVIEIPRLPQALAQDDDDE